VQTRLEGLIEDSAELVALMEHLPAEPGEESPAPSLDAPRGQLVEELPDFMRQKLPEYMLPSAFVVLDELPLTANGKVDRRALPEPDLRRPEETKTFVAPETELEQTIAGIWGKVLEVETLGVHDSFFDLGGNSIHIIQVHSELRQVLNLELPVIKMFEYPTIHSLTQFISEGQEQLPALEKSADRAEARRSSRRRRRARQER
jgi:acyl carrier protein